MGKVFRCFRSFSLLVFAAGKVVRCFRSFSLLVVVWSRNTSMVVWSRNTSGGGEGWWAGTGSSEEGGGFVEV